jgi:hypothetical protein
MFLLFFLFCLGFLFKLFCPCGILDAADPGDKRDESAKKEDGRDAPKNELIELTPPDEDNEPEANDHGDQSSDDGQIFTHKDTSSFIGFFRGDYSKTLLKKQQFFFALNEIRRPNLALRIESKSA